MILSVNVSLSVIDPDRPCQLSVIPQLSICWSGIIINHDICRHQLQHQNLIVGEISVPYLGGINVQKRKYIRFSVKKWQIKEILSNFTNISTTSIDKGKSFQF